MHAALNGLTALCAAQQPNTSKQASQQASKPASPGDNYLQRRKERKCFSGETRVFAVFSCRFRPRASPHLPLTPLISSKEYKVDSVFGLGETVSRFLFSTSNAAARLTGRLCRFLSEKQVDALPCSAKLVGLHVKPIFPKSKQDIPVKPPSSHAFGQAK